MNDVAAVVMDGSTYTYLPGISGKEAYGRDYGVFGRSVAVVYLIGLLAEAVQVFTPYE